MIYIAEIRSAEPAGTAMQRVTITIDDELMTELDRIKGEGTCRASGARGNDSAPRRSLPQSHLTMSNSQRFTAR